MDSPVGRIVTVGPGHATVSVDAAQVCARCAAGKGCGAGLLTGASRLRLIDVDVPPGMDLKPGDDVKLTIAPSHLLHAAVLAYGLPLAGVVIALGIAWIMSRTLNDVLAVVLAICGLVAGALLGRHFLNQHGCLKNLVPTVSERNA